jgi:hypothetical protein
MTKTIARAVLAAGLAIPMAAAGVGRASAQESASLLIVHGVEGGDLGSGYMPGLPINVKIDGTCVTPQPASFGTVLGPYPLAVGAHLVKMSLANTTAPCSGISVMTGHVNLSISRQLALVAAESTSGTLTTEVFDLTEQTPVPDGSARAVMFHTADAPAVDITLTDVSTNSVYTYSNIMPGTRRAGDIPPFKGYDIRVFPTGNNIAIAGPLGFNPADRSVEALFVVGNATNRSATVIMKEINGVY